MRPLFTILITSMLALVSAKSNAGPCDMTTFACIDVVDNSFCQVSTVQSGNVTSFLACFEGGLSSLPPVEKVRFDSIEARNVILTRRGYVNVSGVWGIL